jgi:hypothetical protein
MKRGQTTKRQLLSIVSSDPGRSSIGKRQISNRQRKKQTRHGRKSNEGGAPATPGEHAAAMEDMAGVLSRSERLTSLRLLKTLDKHAAETRK